MDNRSSKTTGNNQQQSNAAANSIPEKTTPKKSLTPPVFQLQAKSPSSITLDEIVLDPTSEIEAKEAGEKHAAIIAKEGIKNIREEILVNLDYFEGSARALYLEMLRVAYRNYKKKPTPEESEETSPTPEEEKATTDVSAETAPAVVAIRKEIQALLKTRPKRNYRNEENLKVRQTLIQGIKRIRPKISGLKATDLKTDNKGLKQIKMQLFMELAAAGPYFSQGTNANILPHPTAGNAASSRTCNITALAMTLQGLGKSSAEFKGNLPALQLISALYTGKFNQKYVDKFGIDKSDIKSWRLPDFLQILAIFHELRINNALPTAKATVDKQEESTGKKMKSSAKKRATKKELAKILAEGNDIDGLVDTLTTQQKDTPKDFAATIKAAQKQAAGNITHTKTFTNLAAYFGVKASTSYYQTTILSEFGDYHRQFANKSKKKAKADERTRRTPEAENEAKTQLDATGKKYSKRRLKNTKNAILSKWMKTAESQKAIATGFDNLQKKKYDYHLGTIKDQYAWLYLKKLDVHKEWLAELMKEDKKFKMPKKSRSINYKLRTLLKKKAKAELEKDGKKAKKSAINAKVNEYYQNRYRPKLDEVWKEIESGEKEPKGRNAKKLALRYKAFKSVRSDEEMNKVLPLETYKNDVTQIVQNAKASGQEIIILMKGHYVRFEQLYEDGLIENDPGSYTRPHAKVPWQEAWRKGYFRAYTLLK